MIAEWLEKHSIPCLIKSSTGVDCPGCGTQRAIIALCKGHLWESIQYHAAIIPFFITLLLLLWQMKFKHVNGGKWVMWSFIVTVGITLVQYIVKQVIGTTH